MDQIILYNIVFLIILFIVSVISTILGDIIRKKYNTDEVDTKTTIFILNTLLVLTILYYIN
jgi:hypothetical protein